MTKIRRFGADLAVVQLGIVNACLVGTPQSWVLLDTGLPGNRTRLLAVAREIYGDRPPRAVVLTHGHGDHLGTAAELADHWRVPIFAHTLELPYCTGQSAYPPFDPTVGGPFGLAVRLMPALKADLGERVRPLPPDGALPWLEGWRWLPTPGHSPGHISLVHDDTRRVLAGDALATLDAERWSGPRAGLAPSATPVTCDWQAALRSMSQLAALNPELLVCGHGRPFAGEELAGLTRFVESYVPPAGRYRDHPAVCDEHGIVSLPPAPPDPLPARLALAGAAVALGCLALRRSPSLGRGAT